MARKIVAVVAVASLLSGCTHVHRIDPVASGPELDDLNRALQRRRVSVEAVGSVPHRRHVKLRAEGVRVAADSTSLIVLREPSEISGLWGEPRYGVKRDTTLSTSAIRRMTATTRLQGAVDGAVVGLGMGVALGAILGATGPKGLLTTGEAAAAGGLILGALAAGVGLVVGATVGSREVYDFVDR